mmetsp:Transcript_111952/g.280486  ORF Transcript_111952/g.280486 Transcript_111952/m.280486 type:complete len:205 (-) Transcript_111952:589-1203(-)
MRGCRRCWRPTPTPALGPPRRSEAAPTQLRQPRTQRWRRRGWPPGSGRRWRGEGRGLFHQAHALCRRHARAAVAKAWAAAATRRLRTPPRPPPPPHPPRRPHLGLSRVPGSPAPPIPQAPLTAHPAPATPHPPPFPRFPCPLCSPPHPAYPLPPRRRSPSTAPNASFPALPVFAATFGGIPPGPLLHDPRLRSRQAPQTQHAAP